MKMETRPAILQNQRTLSFPTDIRQHWKRSPKLTWKALTAHLLLVGRSARRRTCTAKTSAMMRWLLPSHIRRVRLRPVGCGKALLLCSGWLLLFTIH